MKSILITLATMLIMSAITIKAQSVSHAKSLIEQGKYLEAAKQLRPLADSGDDEAQYLAATLFFEGKGVNKNDAQGINYATLSANQGNTDAILLLADHYKEKGQIQKYYVTLDHYTERHPYLKRELIGIRLAECFMRGWGVEQDEEKAWEMSKENRYFKKMQYTYPNQWENYKNHHPELFSTQIFDNIRISQGPSFCTIKKVVFEAERTIVHLRYFNTSRVPKTISTAPRVTYIEAGGKRFKCTGSSMQETVVGYNKGIDYNMYFEPVQRNINSFDLIEDTRGGWAWRGVSFK